MKTLTFLNRLHSDDLARLILRVTVGGLMLFHGVDKIRNGIGGIVQGAEGAGLPGFIGYGVYVGEILAPLMLIVGFWTRPAALVLAFNMIMAVYIAHRGDVFAIGDHGEWKIELQAFYFFASLAIFFTGAGRFSASRGKGPLD